MYEDLYFVPMIAEALGRTNPGAELARTFERIRAMGRDRRHYRGYRQFLEFVDSVDRTASPGAPEPVREQIPRPADRSRAVDLLVEREDVLVATVRLERAPAGQVVDGIAPGQYRLMLDTGRVLWRGCLTEEDLLWAKAFPGRPLAMAADSTSARRRPSRRIDLLGGAVIVRVHAGMESGSLEIHRPTRKGRQP